MKTPFTKILIASLILSAPLIARADVPPSITDQVTTALTQHATFALEYRHGSKNLILSDNVVEIGRLRTDYLLALDAGVNGATLPGQTVNAIQFTNGLRLNASAIVKHYVVFKPEWTFLTKFEYFGRLFYNWSDRTWRGSVNLGYGFGPGTGN